MTESVLIGQNEAIRRIPQTDWKQEIRSAPESINKRLAFMSEDHHLVRNFVVRELPRLGRSISMDEISSALGISRSRTTVIVEELEKNLFFLVRMGGEEVSWAFPVTSEATGHNLVFSTGERLGAAWAEDAIATPFVQGHLRKEFLEVEITSTCAHSGRPVRFIVDSDLNARIMEGDHGLLIFEPDIDWSKFKAPNIINGYWRKCLFFWSEENAREFRLKGNQVNGTYLTIDQCCFSTRIVQGALFAL